jgi:VWFA-related protein
VRIAVALVAVGLSGALALEARQSPSSPQQPTFRSTVDVVQVDVSVLDRQRRPVLGLTSNSFTILENGRPQEIVAFVPVDVPEPALAPAAWVRDTAPDVRSNDLGDGRLFAIVMDDATIPADARLESEARKIARSVVNRLGPSDLAAVIFVMNSRRSVDFTTDRRRLLAAIDAFTAGSAYSDPNGGTDNYLYYSSIRTLGQISTQLGGVPHRRKAVIYVSCGVPVDLEAAAKVTPIGPSRPVIGMPIDGSTIEEDTARDLMAALSEMLTERPQEAYGLALRDTFVRAQHGNVNIYSIDPGGAGGLQAYLQANVRRPVVGAPLLTPVEAFQTSRLHRDFLETVSESSGGRAIVNTNDLEAGVAQIFRENSSYYLIGYRSTREPSDRSVRKVTVKVDRPGVTAHTRNAYYDPRTQPRALPAPAPIGMRHALSGILPNPEITLQVSVAPFALANRPDTALAIVLGVRHPALGGDFGARVEDTLEVMTAAFTREGTERKTARHTARVVGRAGAGNDVQYDVLSQIELPPGSYQLRLAVQSAALNKTGSVYANVDVPDFRREPLALSGVVLSAAPAPLAAPEGPLAPLLPVAPTTERSFTANSTVSVFCRIYQGRSAPEAVTVTTHIVDTANTVVRRVSASLDATAFDAARSADYHVPVPLSDLRPGTYLLTIEVAAGSRVVRRDVRFDVAK